MSSHQRSTDVAIIGGGVIGLAVAWRAAQHGLRVVVLERGEPGAATSRVAAGMIAPISEATMAEQALLSLGRASAGAYPEFIAELRETTGHDPGYRQCGTLFVARDSDEAAVLERELAMREGLGLPVRRLLPSAARRLEPALAPTARLGLEIPDDHAIDPALLTRALHAAFVAAGGQLSSQTGVVEIVCSDDRVLGVRRADGSVVHAGQVVVAAGPWSGGIAGLPEAAQIRLRPVKGQILALHDPSGPGLLSRAVRMQPGYIVPRGDGRYVLGATMEERGFDTTVTAGPVFELLRDAIELVPGLAELVIDELRSGIRPGTADNAPLLGPGALPGLHWATGHHRHGILLAPVTASILLAALTDELRSDGGAAELAALATRFTPARFTPVGAGV